MARALFPAQQAKADAEHATAAALAAVRGQYLRIGADTSGCAIFCHVLDLPADWGADLPKIDRRALRAAKHRAAQVERVPFNPAAFKLTTVSGVWGPQHSAETVALLPCADVFAAAGLNPEAGEQRPGIEVKASRAGRCLPSSQPTGYRIR